ncbi:two-component response regulator [Flavobacterium noncentrifugens]|uniref:Response regulator receiver domain-containing protein n=1 Tax=Flavobacterium noncentrifugens TaxID=1128970 RepID=A0A1G8Y1R5_9FLAO|nr:response regulator [Flavobacterium noncentrifugens]GEP52252.1 two-component response regulator [Flavobacterium noncentrifugens]SDJ95980.1 Response regulator receiver domain-containing protein [Flavobacterium noncentrifugens]
MKILVVDDEADVESLFLQRFRKEIRSGEIEFDFALSGEAALSYLGAHHSEVILILSDINMPGMSGIELLSKIRTAFSAPPPMVMMVTAYGDEENHRQAIANGANDFLTKPLDFALLKDKLKHLSL